MTLNKWLFGTLALGLLSACSSDDAPKTNTGNGNAEGNVSYLAVNIFSPSQGTRGEGDQTEVGDPVNGTFEEGFASENDVKRCVFYFFKEDGNPAYVKATENGDYVNFIEAKNPTSEAENNPSETIEKIVKAKILISTKEGDKLPTKVVAVINGVEPDENMTLDGLKARINNYASTLSNGFIMTNSVYADNNGEEVFETNLTTENFQTSETAAEANAVDIYVERVVAKVRVSLNFGTDNNLAAGKVEIDGITYIPAYKDNNYEDQYTTSDGKKIYIALNGWDVTAVADKTTLKKVVDTAWTNPLNGFYWNVPTYKRSFWAKNADGINPVWDKKVNEFSKSFGTTSDGSKLNQYNAYLNENVPAYSGSVEPFSKVVMAGTLVTLNETTGKYEPLNLIKYMGVYYADEEAVKDQIATFLNNKITLWKQSNESSDGVKVYNKITGDDIELVSNLHDSADDPDNNAKENGGRYLTYPELKEGHYFIYDGTNYTEVNLASTTDPNAIVVNEFLEENSTRYWEGGATYYFFTIQHLGTDSDKEGFYGVVRNHIYDCTVTALVGLGTPVKDPEEQIIYPEKPGDQDWYMAAKINILSWRVVKNDYNLEW